MNTVSSAIKNNAQAAHFLPPGNPFLGLLPRRFWRKKKDFYSYTMEWLPLAANGTATDDFQVDNNADFLLLQINRVVTQTDNTTVKTFAPFLLRLTDTGSGANFSDIPVHIENVAGTAQLPFVLPFPKVLERGSSMTGQLQNLDAGTAYNVRLEFIGMRISDKLEMEE